MGLPEDLRNTRRVVVGGLGHAVVEGLPYDQSAERVFLEVEEPSRPLNVGERCGICPRLKLVQFAAGRPIAEVAHKLLIVQLADAEEIDDLEVQIIEHLDIRGRLVKEHLAPPGRLHIGGVLGQHGDDFCGKTVLAADISQGSDHE